MKQLQQNLQALGLSPNDATVYLALLKLGRSHAGPLITKTKLHRMLVYQALERLVSQRLVSVMEKKSKKFWQAAQPTMLMENVKTLESIAGDTIYQLQELQRQANEQLDINVLYGHDGFIANLRTVVQLAAKSDKILRILGGARGDFFYEAIGDWYAAYIKLLQKYKVKKWQISPESNSAAFKNRFAKESNTVLKTMKFGLASPIQTRLTPNMASIEIFAKEIVVIQIYNRAVANGYLDYFNLLWRQAKTYKS